MNIDIRKHIIDNFKDSTYDEIQSVIESTIKEKEELALPGLGVFMELLWMNSDENSKSYIVNTLLSTLTSTK